MMGIRLKLIIFIVLPVVILVSGFGYFLGVRELEQVMMHEMRMRAKAMMAALTRGCLSPLSNHEIWKLDNIISRFSGKNAKELDVNYVFIVDYEGYIRADSENRYLQRITAPFVLEVAQKAQQRWRIIKGNGDDTMLEMITPIGKKIRWGAAVAGFSLVGIKRDIRRKQHGLLLFVLIFAGVLSGVLYFALSKSIIEPIRELSRTAELVGRGKLEERSRVPSGDEIGQLAKAFNEMTDQLQQYTNKLEDAVERRTRQLQELNEQLERLAITDGLTGLFNQRYFKEHLTDEIARCRRTSEIFSLIIFDIDSFKRFNDTNGHLQGDKLLSNISELLRKGVRKTDMVARYGGEEFVVMAVGSPTEGARQLAEKIRESVEEYPFHYRESQPGGRITVSGGISTFPMHGDTPEAVIEKADKALYRAKAAGRNRIECALPPGESV